jgi:hypothetical protein
MPEDAERMSSLIRAVVFVLAVASIVIASSMSLPTAIRGAPPEIERRLPSVALGQQAIYRLEVGLAVFYGGLIAFTPLYYGLVRGRVPIEISARGARFSEDAVERVRTSVGSSDEDLVLVRNRLDRVEQKLLHAQLDIDQITGRDQP